MKWIKDNWLLIILLFVIGIFVVDRLFKDSSLRKDLRESDARIQELDEDNKEKDKVILEAARMAEQAEQIVAAKEKIIAKKDLRIKELMKKEERVGAEVRRLPSVEVVLQTAEFLGCLDGVRLQDQEVVFTLACAKKNLAALKRFPLVVQQRDMALSAELETKEALQFQKIATWNVYRLAWAQSWQISNLKKKYKEKDRQFSLAMKDRRKRWLDGLWKGFVAGVIISFALRMLLKK